MDNIFRDGGELPIAEPEPEFAPDIDFPEVVPERSGLPRRPVSQDELDMIPQQDEF